MMFVFIDGAIYLFGLLPPAQDWFSFILAAIPTFKSLQPPPSC